MVKITIVGTGYVGLVTGTCLAEIGHDVICSDISEEKINLLKKGEIPIYEKDLDILVKKNMENKKLNFTTNVEKAIQISQIIFSCVGTPMGEDYKADLKYVKAVAKVFAKNLNEFKLFVNKSTVPVGTGDLVKNIIDEFSNLNSNFGIISNPEFLREGSAVKDFLNPDRIVIGVENLKAKQLMSQVYLPLINENCPILYTNVRSAELIKYASNSMLATRISFMNEIANFCDKVGANVNDVANGMGLDSRIGPHFLQAGIGYGGSCFPKDVVALIESGREVGLNFEILESVEKVNLKQKTIIIDKLLEKFGNLDNKIFTIWGLTFKAGTDDIRESPAIYIIRKLLNLNVKVKVYDKIAFKNFNKYCSELNVEYFNDKYEALVESDGLLVLTDWDEFKYLDFKKMNQMNFKLIFDGRNLYNSVELLKNNFDYIGIGVNSFQKIKLKNFL